MKTSYTFNIIIYKKTTNKKKQISFLIFNTPIHSLFYLINYLHNIYTYYI